MMLTPDEARASRAAARAARERDRVLFGDGLRRRPTPPSAAQIIDAGIRADIRFNAALAVAWAAILAAAIIGG